MERYCCCELFLLVPLKPELFPPGKQMRLQIKHTHKISCLFTNSCSEVHIQPSIWWWLGCCLHRCLKCAVVKILSPFLAFLSGGISPLLNCFSLWSCTKSPTLPCHFYHSQDFAGLIPCSNLKQYNTGEG